MNEESSQLPFHKPNVINSFRLGKCFRSNLMEILFLAFGNRSYFLHVSNWFLPQSFSLDRGTNNSAKRALRPHFAPLAPSSNFGA